MNTTFLSLLIGSVLFWTSIPASAATPTNQGLTGQFEYAEGDTRPKDRNIWLTVTKDANAKYSLEFGAGHSDAHGAAPDGSGDGQIGSDGILRFSFEDSFSNKGKGTFQHSKRGYILLIQISDAQDPSVGRPTE